MTFAVPQSLLLRQALIALALAFTASTLYGCGAYVDLNYYQDAINVTNHLHDLCNEQINIAIETLKANNYSGGACCGKLDSVAETVNKQYRQQCMTDTAKFDKKDMRHFNTSHDVFPEDVSEFLSNNSNKNLKQLFTDFQNECAEKDATCNCKKDFEQADEDPVAKISIEGVTGPNAFVVNGQYELQGSDFGNTNMWKKVGSANKDTWLRYFSDQSWHVTQSDAKASEIDHDVLLQSEFAMQEGCAQPTHVQTWYGSDGLVQKDIHVFEAGHAEEEAKEPAPTGPTVEDFKANVPQSNTPTQPEAHCCAEAYGDAGGKAKVAMRMIKDGDATGDKAIDVKEVKSTSATHAAPTAGKAASNSGISPDWASEFCTSERFYDDILCDDGSVVPTNKTTLKGGGEAIGCCKSTAECPSSCSVRAREITKHHTEKGVQHLTKCTCSGCAQKPKLQLSDEDRYVKATNYFRCLHGHSALTWSADAAAAAQATATASCHAGQMTAKPDQIMAGGQANVEAAVATWYGEIKTAAEGKGYIPGTSAADAKYHGVGNQVTDYATMIWKSTTEFGCGGGCKMNGNTPVYACQFPAMMGSHKYEKLPSSERLFEVSHDVVGKKGKSDSTSLTVLAGVGMCLAVLGVVVSIRVHRHRTSSPESVQLLDSELDSM